MTVSEVSSTPAPAMSTAAANQANAVTGVYGITGSGKTSLLVTAIEYAYETFNALTLFYAADLGGFGTRLLALIRLGIARVYDPRNHVYPFETMELISLGAFPERLIDPERGYADPNVRLILPRRMVYDIYCSQGHLVRRFEDERVMNATVTPCPTCGLATSPMNCSKVDKQVVRHRMFRDVGLRCYDSMTALNDWGMQDMQDQSAKGTLPSGLLGAADALVSGSFRFGASSESQYGFLQNRTYGWLANIRAIPDQVMPAIATFHVELSKEAKGNQGGGDLLYGPKIAGNARTAAIGGWLGNCLHSSVEPRSQEDQTLVHRLWLHNHIDPRDPRKLPYVAKHRGSPLGMPDYLEDAPGEPPWTGFSLKVFFSKLQEQLEKEQADAAKRYPNAPGVWLGEDAGAEQADDVVAAVTPAAGAVGAPVAAGPAVTGRTRRRAGQAAAPATQVPAAPVGPRLASMSTEAPAHVEVQRVVIPAPAVPASMPASVSAPGPAIVAPVNPVGAGTPEPASALAEAQAQAFNNMLTLPGRILGAIEAAVTPAAAPTPNGETAGSAPLTAETGPSTVAVPPVVSPVAVAPPTPPPMPSAAPHAPTPPRLRRVARPVTQ